eukprot:CAMPEP_0185850290 /NCGR_PEP_ID=MMETSP1354-20130828/4479_1 /TAXON_ID=708628 /ORGANISM="Erythrolobus madagascarensis, Strain CCMP3276" /LENGTH=275 /DNA_ID=CAMNT_0028550951 /DNA_START=59 /DNA_END=886 /DNA_ORIENTATION=-
MSWEYLRREARRIENELDAKLLAYSKLSYSFSAPQHTTNAHHNNNNSSSSTHAKSTDGGLSHGSSGGLDQRQTSRDLAISSEHMEVELDALLAQLADVIVAMGRLTGGEGAGGLNNSHSTPVSVMNHTLQRHEEILADHQRDFRRTRKTMMVAREQAELFSGAGANGSRGMDNNSGAMSGDRLQDASLQAERASLASAASMADSSVGQGLSLRDELFKQRAAFASMMDRMETMGQSVPALNALIGQIKRRKKRDVLIFAFVLAALVFCTAFWKLL